MQHAGAALHPPAAGEIDRPPLAARDGEYGIDLVERRWRWAQPAADRAPGERVGERGEVAPPRLALAGPGSARERIEKDLEIDLTGRHVLIVEDIVDSGLTLAYLRKNLAARGPASLEVCALLLKEGLQRNDLDLRYVGFRIPPDFVVGYGLDVGERYRNLPAVYEYTGLLTG